MPLNELKTYGVPLHCGDRVTANGVSFRIMKIAGDTVWLDIDAPDDFELTNDDGPDVGETAIDPNAEGVVL
jgi:hypothetical protein